MRALRFLLVAVLGAVAGGAAVHFGAPTVAHLLTREEAIEPTAQYQCPMHPEIVSNEPGICPICQMKLQKVDAVAPPPARPAERKPIFYRHPMRSDVTSPLPAKDEMGMDYIPVFMDDLNSHESDVPGHAGFTLSNERQQLIGVRREKVERKPLDEEIRAVGKVAYDPGLYQAIVEYREALVAKQNLQGSHLAEAHEGANAVVRASTLRLRQLGISEQQLREVAESGQDPTNLLLPGRSVWIYAQVYEYESDLVRPGAAATITAPSAPGRVFKARVTSVDPILNSTTRTARVRLQVATPDADLRPESFVQVKIEVASKPALVIPSDAVLHTGDREIVFVVKGDGAFEPRAVTLGRESHGEVEVLAGLAEGDEIVTSANFLIDSESRFRAALAAFGKK